MNIGSYKSNIKFQLLQRFVPHLITEIKEHDRSYVPPAARTNNAMMLFPQRVCATITEPAVVPPQVSITTVVPPQVRMTITESKAGSQTCTTNKAPKVVLTGVKTFKSIQEYRAFIRVGQHPMHASPCVCVTGMRCSNELVFEEWLDHKRTSNDSTTREYLCRRRRRPHQRKRKHKPTENNHSEESQKKQVKSIAKSKKGMLSVVRMTEHTTVHKVDYDHSACHSVHKSFASH